MTRKDHRDIAILALYALGSSLREIAQLYDLSHASVGTVIRLFQRKTGLQLSRPRGNPWPKRTIGARSRKRKEGTLSGNALKAQRIYTFSKKADQAQCVKRKCLRCKRSFMSEWVGNRICGQCKQITAHIHMQSRADQSVFGTSDDATRRGG